MVEQYLFFSSTFDDRRRYSAADIAKYWRSFLSSGLIHKNGEPALRVVANAENMTVQFDDGKALIFGHLYIKDGDLPFTLSPSSATEDRFDRIVLRLDNTRGDDNSRFIRAFLKEGTADGPPELERTFIEDTPIIYEISLAQIHVKAGKSYVEQSDIIDERFNEELCGLASSLVTVPTDDLMREWQAWFRSIKDATYITNEEFTEKLGKTNREVANLNLHLNARERVQQGITFGSDFEDTFGMEWDLGRSIINAEYISGADTITVEDASVFLVGDSVTIYDDESLDRTKIVDITDNSITIEPMEKNFINAANIAKTMAVLNGTKKMLEFGVWGSYEIVPLSLFDFNPSPTGNEKDSTNNLVVLDGYVFWADTSVTFTTTQTPKIYRRNKDGSVSSKAISGHFNTNNASGMNILTDGIHIYVIDAYLIATFDIEMNQTSETNVMSSGTTHKMAGSYLDIPNSRFVVFIQRSVTGGQAKDVYELPVELTTGLVGSRSTVLSIYQTPQNASVGQKIISLPNETIILVAGTERHVIKNGSKTTQTAIGTGNGELFVHDGTCYEIKASTTEVLINKSNDGATWDLTTVPLGTTLEGVPNNTGSSVTMDDKGSIYVVGKVAGVPNYVVMESDKTSFSAPKAFVGVDSVTGNLNAVTTQKLTYREPLAFVFSSRTKKEFLGEVSVGDGAPVDTNDVRFTLPSSDAVAFWITTETGVSITSCDINGEVVRIDNRGDEYQVIFNDIVKSKKKVRFTMKRNDMENVNGLTKLVGGRE